MPSSGLQHTGINKHSLAAIRILALTAAGIAGYLTWVTLTHGTVAACGDQPSHLACDDVLRSAWSRVVGVPVSLLGFVVYVAILVTSRWIVSKPSQPLTEWTRLCCLTLIALAFGAATWFLFLQLFVIRHICPFCLIIHVCGIMIALISCSAIVMEEARRRRPSYLETIQQLTVGTVSAAATMPESYRQLTPKKHWSVLVAACALLVLVVLQVFFSTKTYEVLE
ncbi:MAG: vitamin K epoxide reductase family protein, partial [Pseudomonadales bacterium]